MVDPLLFPRCSRGTPSSLLPYRNEGLLSYHCQYQTDPCSFPPRRRAHLTLQTQIQETAFLLVVPVDSPEDETPHRFALPEPGCSPAESVLLDYLAVANLAAARHRFCFCARFRYAPTPNLVSRDRKNKTALFQISENTV
eukprot:3330661-Rhodomonas_salina.3